MAGTYLHVWQREENSFFPCACHVNSYTKDYHRRAHRPVCRAPSNHPTFQHVLGIRPDQKYGATISTAGRGAGSSRLTSPLSVRLSHRAREGLGFLVRQRSSAARIFTATLMCDDDPHHTCSTTILIFQDLPCPSDQRACYSHCRSG